MAKDIDVEQLKSRGLSCGKLKSMVKNKRKDAEMFRKVGFNSLASSEEQAAQKL